MPLTVFWPKIFLGLFYFVYISIILYLEEKSELISLSLKAYHSTWTELTLQGYQNSKWQYFASTWPWTNQAFPSECITADILPKTYEVFCAFQYFCSSSPWCQVIRQAALTLAIKVELYGHCHYLVQEKKDGRNWADSNR